MNVTKAVQDVLAERERQKDKGFTTTRDDFYESDMLNAGAAVYLSYAYNYQHLTDEQLKKALCPSSSWPFDDAYYKPSKDPRRNLVKGVALGLAEIERLDRSEGICTPVPRAETHSETKFGHEIHAIRDFLGIPDDMGTLEYIHAAEYCLAIPPQRNDIGLWTHPAYVKAFGGVDVLPAGIFGGWLDGNDLESKTVVFAPTDTGEISWDDVAAWEPEAPKGEGWFIGSIHESENEGVVCVWLRKKTK